MTPNQTRGQFLRNHSCNQQQQRPMTNYSAMQQRTASSCTQPQGNSSSCQQQRTISSCTQPQGNPSSCQQQRPASSCMQPQGNSSSCQQQRSASSCMQPQGNSSSCQQQRSASSCMQPQGNSSSCQQRPVSSCPGPSRPWNQMTQEQLLQWITWMKFACVDASLYLDTHPCDPEALSYFQEYNRLYNEAMNEYAKAYGPLTISHAKTCDTYWEWVNQPWPWQ